MMYDSGDDPNADWDEFDLAGRIPTRPLDLSRYQPTRDRARA